MPVCKPDTLLASSPSAVVFKQDNVSTLSVINSLFCYIYHTFLPSRSVKESNDNNMTIKHNKTEVEEVSAVVDTSGGASNVAEVGTVEKKIKKYSRLPIFKKRLKKKTSDKNIKTATVEEANNLSSANFIPNITDRNSTLSVSKSLSCHLLVTPKLSKTIPKRTSAQSIQVTPPKKVKIDAQLAIKSPKKLSREIQVGGTNLVLNSYTSQLEVVPPSRGDTLSTHKTSPMLLKTNSSSQPIQKKRTYPDVNPPLLRNKAIVAASKKPCIDLSQEKTENIEPPKKITISNSSQTIESWPVLQKRLNLFERTKKKLIKDKEKQFTSTYVQAVKPPIRRANVKCLVSTEKGNKATLVKMTEKGLERVESCVNTETNDTSSGIQCDIAMRRSRTPKRITSSGKMKFTLDLKKDSVTDKVNEQSEKSKIVVDETKKDDVITVLSNRLIDSKDSKSDTVYSTHQYSDINISGDDPLHCLNEFLSLERMLHRLQDEIHGLDTSIRQISNNYQLPSTTLTTAPPTSSFHSKLKSVENTVRNYQNELDMVEQQFCNFAYRRL